MNPFLNRFCRRPRTKDLPTAYRKNEKRILAKKARRTGKWEVREQCN